MFGAVEVFLICGGYQQKLFNIGADESFALFLGIYFGNLEASVPKGIFIQSIPAAKIGTRSCAFLIAAKSQIAKNRE